MSFKDKENLDNMAQSKLQKKYVKFSDNIDKTKNIESTSNENNKVISLNDNNKKSIQDELIYFKNDILKDIKNTEYKLNQKYGIQNNGFENRLGEIERKTNELVKKYSIINEAISAENIIKEKISFLELFKIKTEETLLTLDYRIKNVNKELNNTIIKYDKIFLDTVIYPTVIGKQSQFKSFHELIDYLLLHVNRLIHFREKEVLENKANKNKLDAFIENMKKKVNYYMNNSSEYTNKRIKNTEEITFNKIDDINKQILNINIDFDKKLMVFERKIDDLTCDMVNKIKDNSNDYYIKITKDILNINDNMKLIKSQYEQYIKNYDLMKNEVESIKYILLNYFSTFEENNQNNKNNSNNNNSTKITIKNNNENNNSFNIKYIGNINNNNFNINNNDIINNNNINNISNNNVKDNINKDKYPYLLNVDSIIKKYINGLININDIKRGPSIKRQESPLKRNTDDTLIAKDTNIIKHCSNIFIGNKRSINNENLESEETNLKIRSCPIIKDIKKHIEYISNVMGSKTINNSIFNKSNIQNRNDKKDMQLNNLKLNKSQSIINNNNIFAYLNEDMSNSKLKKQDLISKDNYDINDKLINSNYNNDDQLKINTLKYIRKESREQYNYNLMNKNISNDISLMNSSKYSKRIQTPKINKKIRGDLDYPIKKNYFNDEKIKLLSFRQNNDQFASLSQKDKSKIIPDYEDNEKDKNMNINKFNEKKNNYILRNKKGNNNYDLKKVKRLLSSSTDNVLERRKLNKIEVSFDDQNYDDKKNNEKFENYIKLIKDILPKEEKEFFLERMKKLGYNNDKKMIKKNISVFAIKKNVTKYQLNSINNNTDFIKRKESSKKQINFNNNEQNSNKNIDVNLVF